MPTKPNYGGEQQNYVPQGNGDLDEIQDADLVTDSKGGKSLPGFGAKK